jgi:serine/threonine protein kinase
VQKVRAILPIGTVLNGQYIVESLLGKGGFGNVYLARDQHDTQQLFALAELLNPKERGGYRLTLHYVLPPPLRHRAVPQAQSVFTDDTLGRTCLLVRYSEEPHLEILRSQQPEQRFPLPQVMTIMAPIMSAVSQLHQQHPPVIHQHIKPASIIVPRTTGEPVLALLRIVKKQGVRWSPAPYFAPCYGALEQYREEFSTRSDIYGLGATCYLLVTGRVPPDALYRATHLEGTGVDLLKPVNEVVPTLPTFTADAIQQAMALEEDHRFSSVEQFWEALWSPMGRFSLSRSQSGPPPSLPPPATPKQAVTRPATIAAPRPPQASRNGKPGFLWPFARKQIAEKPAPVPEPLHSPRSWRLGILIGGLLALFTVLVVGVSLWSHATAGTPAHSAIVTPRHTASAVVTPPSQPTGTSTTFPTTPVSGLPMVAGSYQGTLHNTPADVTSTMSLTHIKQDSGKISGYLALGPGLLGDGFFSGTVNTARRIQFTVPGVFGNRPLHFSGIVQADGRLKGSYCSLDQTNHCNPSAGGYGIWNVKPAIAGQASSPLGSTSPHIADRQQGIFLVHLCHECLATKFSSEGMVQFFSRNMLRGKI